MRMTWVLLAGAWLAGCGTGGVATDSGQPTQDASVDTGTAPTYCIDSTACPPGQGCALGVCRAFCGSPAMCPANAQCGDDTEHQPVCRPTCSAEIACDPGTQCLLVLGSSTQGLCGVTDAGM